MARDFRDILAKIRPGRPAETHGVRFLRALIGANGHLRLIQFRIMQHTVIKNERKRCINAKNSRLARD